MEFFSRFIAITFIIVLMPLFFIISLILFFLQGLPIFFIQDRVGYKFKTFKLFKFRTMLVNQSGNFITIKGDDRITKIGKILRALKLDEIPQLINIVKGDMRFIGPRPEVEKYVEKNTFDFLKKIKPGLSDFSSIIFRNEEYVLAKLKSHQPYIKILLPIKIQLAQIYSNNKSFNLDLILTMLTIIAIFFPKLAQHFLLKNIVKNFNPIIVNKINKILKYN
tara:strand:- start:38 stop:700 length:663 start_codon:yes stop_codon:yes gene_type:complete